MANTQLSAKIALRVIDSIKADMEAGNVPATTPTLSALHDVVDANEYFIEALDALGIEFDAASDEQADYTNQAQRMVDTWLGARP